MHFLVCPSSLDLDSKNLEDVNIPDYMEVTADVKDFSLDMTMTFVMSDILQELDVDQDIDLSGIEDAIDSLSDASAQLVSGSRELADGTGTLLDGINAYTSGVSTLKSGINAYTDGVAQVKTVWTVIQPVWHRWQAVRSSWQINREILKMVLHSW